MHSSPEPRIHTHFHILWVGAKNAICDSIVEYCQSLPWEVRLSTSEKLEDINLRKYHILLVDFETTKPSQFEELFLKGKDLKPMPIVLAYSNRWTTGQIGSLKNQLGVFGFSDDQQSLFADLKMAMEEYQKRIQYFGAMKKIRNQNSRLELLTKNLEKIVLDRTKQDSESNAQAQERLKSIQDLLRFVKQAAGAETLEEVLSVVRGEYKKIHGLRPPLLLFPEGGSLLKVYYFQHKQFMERMIAVEDLDLLNQEDGPEEREFQVFLSELFARPFGHVESFRLQWNLKNLPSSQGYLVFEHSLSPENLVEFQAFSNERLPVLHLAIENILLRDRSQNMARQWANTFNKIQDPILILNSKYEMTLANSQLKKMESGVCYKDFAGREKPCVGCPVETSIRTAEPQSADIRCLGKTYRVHSFPIFLEEQDQVTHVIHQYVNMTDTRDLQGRVIQGEKMAAIGMLAGNVAHELNNPLTGIYSLSDLLLGDLDESSNTYKDLVEVKDATRRCQRIIKDLLEFSNLETQRMQTTDLNSVVSKTLSLVKMALRNHNSQVSLFEEPLPVKVQPQLFQQVVFNLVNNGCQAMSEGGTLSIESSSEKGFAILKIQDTGPGIPKELREVIFDPFFTTKQVGKGTGLGLSMSRSVVEKFAGELRLNPDYQGGSEFIIRLPLAKGEV